MKIIDNTEGHTIELMDLKHMDECSNKMCVPLKELARLLGWRRSWTSDDIDWKVPKPDVSQFIANACTGKIRLYFEWSRTPRPSAAGQTLAMLQAELIRRNKCLYCEQLQQQQITSEQPFCAACAVRLENNQRQQLPYDVTLMDAKTKQQRLERLGWVRAACPM